MDALVRDVREFYADQMEVHGFGRKTFSYGGFKAVVRAGDDGDNPITGGQSFIMVAQSDSKRSTRYGIANWLAGQGRSLSHSLSVRLIPAYGTGSMA